MCARVHVFYGGFHAANSICAKTHGGLYTGVCLDIVAIENQFKMLTTQFWTANYAIRTFTVIRAYMS
jgi:hypothetical protein